MYHTPTFERSVNKMTILIHVVKDEIGGGK